MREHSLRRQIIALLLFSTLAATSLSAADAASAEVTIRVLSKSRQPVRNAYVALVPQWRPPSKPIVEKVVDKDTAQFRVPPGVYHAIAGAPGFTVASLGPINVAGGAQLESIALTPLREAVGTITGTDGAPLSGAKVSTIHGLTLLESGSLSELALRHLEKNFGTTTDDRGQWRLALPPARLPLFFSARGRATELRLIEASDQKVDVTLLAGAVLKLELDRTDPDAIVTITREEAQEGASIPATRQAQIWARTATKKLLEWEALPAGRYTIASFWPAPHYFSPAAVPLATMVLAPGAEKTMQATLPARPAAIKTAALFIDGVTPLDLHEAQLFAFAEEKGTRPVAYVVEEVIGGSVLHMRPPDFVDPLFIAPEESFIAATPPKTPSMDPVVASVHSRADVTASFRSLENGVPLPLRGTASLADCGDTERVLVPLPIRPNGFASFPAPSGCRSLTLNLPPFEPTLVDRILQRGDQSLGEILLRAAGTADIRVTVDEDEPVVGSAVEVATRGVDGTPTVVASGKSGKDGWVRFSALPIYRDLRVQAKSDVARSDASPLRLAAGEHAVIDPLPLRPPATLTIAPRIDEQVLLRLPAAKVRAIFVTPADPFRIAEQQQQSLGDKEEVAFKQLAPGRWLISALVVYGPGLYAPVEIDPVELKDGEDRRITPRLKPLVFSGIVTADGMPLLGKVQIELENSLPAFATDANGRFQALLDRPGTYRVVFVKRADQGSHIPVGLLAFTDPGRDIEIDVSETATIHVRAHVGETPVPAQTIISMSRHDVTGSERFTRRGRFADSAGEATFINVAHGDWTFSASDSRSGSVGDVTVTVEGDRTVDLALEEPGTIGGTIYSPAGGTVARAFVECVSVTRTGAIRRMSVTGDVEGRFSISVPQPPPAGAVCGVITGLGSIHAFHAVPGTRHQVRMPAGFGSITIANWRELPMRGSWWLVASDGSAINLGTIERMFPQVPPAMTIPAVPAGRWRIVATQTQSSWDGLARGLGNGVPAAAEIAVRAGGIETITIQTVPGR